MWGGSGRVLKKGGGAGGGGGGKPASPPSAASNPHRFPPPQRARRDVRRTCSALSKPYKHGEDEGRGHLTVLLGPNQTHEHEGRGHATNLHPSPNLTTTKGGDKPLNPHQSLRTPLSTPHPIRTVGLAGSRAPEVCRMTPPFVLVGFVEGIEGSGGKRVGGGWERAGSSLSNPCQPAKQWARTGDWARGGQGGGLPRGRCGQGRCGQCGRRLRRQTP